MSTLTHDGDYVGIDNVSAAVYIKPMPDGPGPWETATITPHEPYADIAYNGRYQLCVNRESKLLESRPLGQFHEWGGTWAVTPAGDAYVATCDNWAFRVDGYVMAKPVYLEQRGWDFVDKAGKRIVLAGVDMFPALRFYRDGGPDALKPFFQESARLGFQVWRIWSQGSKKQNNFLDLSPHESGYYDSIGPFIDCCVKGGIAPLLTCYVDNQDVKSPVPGHWIELTKRGQGKSVLWSGGNQYPKNGFDPWALPAPYAGAIWSRGSSTDDEMTKPKGAPAGELHATRQSFDRALMDSTASPPTMRKPENGYGMVWMTEGMPFGDPQGYTEKQAWQLGMCYNGGDWAMAVFHNRQSQFGQLMTEATARCGAAWAKGLHA